MRTLTRSSLVIVGTLCALSGCGTQKASSNVPVAEANRESEAEVEQMRRDLDGRAEILTKQLQSEQVKMLAEAEKQIRAKTDQQVRVLEEKIAEFEKRADAAEVMLADAEKALALAQQKPAEPAASQVIPAPEPAKLAQKPAVDATLDEKSLPPAVARIVSMVKKLGGSVEFESGTTEILKVDLSNTKTIDLALSQLKSLDRLKVLDLSNTHVTNAALQHIARFAGLEELLLVGTKVNPQQAERQLLPKLPKLKIVWEPPPLLESRVIELVRHAGGQVQVSKATDAPDFYISEVTLPDDNTTDEMLAWLRGLSRIKRLTASSGHITDAGIAYIANLSSLERLRIDWSQVTDSGLLQLSGLTRLRGIGLHGTKVTDAGLIHLKDMKDLEYVYVGVTPVVGIGFGPLTLKSLARIDISLSITDDGLSGMSGLYGLEQLYIQGAPEEIRLTPMAMKAFAAKHPKAAIISWDGMQERVFDGNAWIRRKR